MINRISVLHFNNFGLHKIPSPFLKKLKWSIVKLKQNLFQHLTFPHFILKYLILILSVLNNIIDVAIKAITNTLLFVEIRLFGVKTQIVTFLCKKLFTSDIATPYKMLLFWSGKPNCISNHYYLNVYWPSPFWG